MFGLSPWELLLIFLAILLLFGAKRLPEIGSSLGRGIREFKGSIKEVEGDVRAEITGDTTASSATQETAQRQPSKTEA
ncbi:Sec-independent protein translocase subunit TatA/TatB [Candidatus Palauibacter sp.]|jgi:sec-independent protein translocase protein TatA|uniref:Sec-independent protein translocase subunit TatA/TatB n=1 Tax=Candidatus Palauibacter sp. TaxID=3101350 RepID=UPI003AF2F229